MIARAMLLAATAATIMPWAAAMAQDRSFVCEGGQDREPLRERADNFGMMRILAIYRDRWDAEFVRAQCEAYANGEPYTITCLDEVRDWDAIEESVPDDYYGMSTSDLAPFIAEEGSEGLPTSDAYDYCRHVGAID